MNVPMLSDRSLMDLHELIREALEVDDAQASGPKRYGVREHADWRRQADEFEAELRKRGLDFSPSAW